ncbi:MAG TPA: hypothetical protein VM681_05425 [Candidatus Thermoplasmatota archaeon]|nr:hypothetical protein [Candidatus Thermoplasmatota archaeon]
MGQSTPTTTMALDTFVQRYAAFRAELAPGEQTWFDELVCRARRHGNAINRRPHLDFERPVFLAMLLEGMRELDRTRAELEVVRSQLEEACLALADAGLVVRRVPAPAPQRLGRVGQARLPDAPELRALPA